MVKLILGETSAKKIQQVSLSNDTIKRRISLMATDIKQQVIAEIKSSPMFSIQFDESTNVASCSQLLVFVRYIHMEDVKEEFLYCKALETSATAHDVMDSISNFFDIEGLQWEKLCGVCTDGAPAMLGCKSGFQMKVKEKSSEVRGVHCMIHRYTLACKTHPNFLKKVLNHLRTDDVYIRTCKLLPKRRMTYIYARKHFFLKSIPSGMLRARHRENRIVNFIKKSATTSRLFKQFCKEMDSDHETLLYYTAVRWLSKGNVVTHFFELRTEIKLFLEMIEKDAFVDFFKDETWLQGLAYLADITEQLNKFNLRLQGPDTNILQFGDILRGFIEKIHNWNRRVNQENFAMFENLSNFESGCLQSLENEFKKYFPDLEEGFDVFPQNLFSVMIDIATISEEVQDELLELRNDSAGREIFMTKSLSQFWSSMLTSYSKLSMKALRVIVPFASFYLCESGFSALMHIKSKACNQLDVEDDMRIAISKTQPRISRLACNMQQQKSH